jgi:MFS family permease
MSEKMPTRALCVCVMSTVSVTVTMGITLPFLALVLDSWGVDPWINGLSAASQMIAVLFLAFFGPRFMARFGTKRVIGFGLAGVGLSLALLPIFPNVWIWFPIRFLLGFSSELVWTAGDVWINQLAPEKKRGRIVGLAGFFQHGGFAVGPILLAFLGTDSWVPLYIGIGIVLAGLIPLCLTGAAATFDRHESSARIFHFLRIAPGLMIAGFMFGLIDSAVLSLLPVYGLRKALSPDLAEAMLSIFVIGAMLGQIPMGILAERFGARKLILAGACVSLLCLLAMPHLITDAVMIFPLLGLLGAGLGTFYTVALVDMGRRFKGGSLIGVTTSFMFLWATGAVIGPGISGLAIELGGPDAMPYTGAVLTLAFIFLLIWRLRKDDT